MPSILVLPTVLTTAGDFEHDITDDIDGLSNEQCAGLVNWRAFYRKVRSFACCCAVLLTSSPC